MSNEKEEIKIKIFKIFILQSKYKKISNYIVKLTEHICYLDNLHYLDINKKNILLTSIYNINKNINNIYNNFLINSDNLKFDEEINLLLNNISNSYFTNYDYDNNDYYERNKIFEMYSKIFEPIKPFTDIFYKYLPYDSELNNIFEIVKEIGYTSLDELLIIFHGNNYIKEFSDSLKTYLLEFI
jgi:hypothetical protein